MKKVFNIIRCVECGREITGNTKDEAVRLEMDHCRLNHPELYHDLMNDLSVRQLFAWLMTQIRQKRVA